MIVKCSHCAKMLSQEDFGNHECNLLLKGCRTIDVIYFQDNSYRNKKLMCGWGTDGILYTFKVVPRKPIPMIIPLADEKKQQFRTDEEGTVP